MPPLHSDTVGSLGFRVWRVSKFPTMPRAHTHPDIELNFVEAGFLEYLFAGTRVRVEAGALAVFWGGVPHQLDASSRTGRGVWLTLPIADFLRWPLPDGLQEKLMGGAFAQMPAEPSTVARWLADFEQGGVPRRRVLLLELEAIMHRLALSAAAPVPARGPAGTAHDNASHVARVAAFLAHHYAEDLDLPGIAAAVRLNPKYLARLFKARTRLTVHSYLTRIRVAHAQRILATTNLRVIDVAMQSGFGSLASLYSAFDRVGGGIPPHRYRKKTMAGVA